MTTIVILALGMKLILVRATTTLLLSKQISKARC